MVGVGRDLCGSSSPAPLPKQDHLQQAAQDLVQAGLECLQRWRLHNLPGQPVPVLRHPQREEVLPHVQMELPVLQFMPVAPCPVTGQYYFIYAYSILFSLAIGVNFSRFTFKGIVHRKWRAQTQRGGRTSEAGSLWGGGVFWY